MVVGGTRADVVAVCAGAGRDCIERRRGSAVAGEPTLLSGSHDDDDSWWVLLR